MDSIVEVYYSAFHKVAKREYVTTDISGELCKTDEETEKMLWKYLKEIAFQIFLNSDNVDTADKALIDKARSFMEEYKSSINSGVLETLPVIFHFSSGKEDGGIVFVHRTVVEYFIALKIYEDYFKDINAKADNDMVWNRIYSVLCLREIPIEIITLICTMMNSSNHAISGEFDKEAFYNIFESGIKEEKVFQASTNAEEKYLDCIDLDEDEDVFMIPSELWKLSKSDRNKMVVGNLTWLLSEMGYKNKGFTLLFKYLTPYFDYPLNLSNLFLNYIIYPQTKAITCSGGIFYATSSDEITEYIKKNEDEWSTIRDDVRSNGGTAEIIFPIWNYKNLSECYFQNTHMEYIRLDYSKLSRCHFENAHLHGACLRNTDLSSSYLNDADFSNTNLEKADFRHAYLTNANFTNAKLNGAVFTGAFITGTDFTGADLEDADLNNTYYNSKTKFPEGFVPDSHNMKCICLGEH